MTHIGMKLRNICVTEERVLNLKQKVLRSRRSTSILKGGLRQFLMRPKMQDQITPDHVSVASVSLSALFKAKICSGNSKNMHGRNFH